MTIPATVEEVTPAWLGEVLDADVAAVEVVDAHSGTTGRAKIRVDTTADLPETLFLKLQPFEAEQRSFLAMVGLGVAEAKLYAAVGDDLPVRVPKVWHSSFDEADSSFIMVLEDLDAAGCRFATPDDDDVLDVATSLVDELATLHAAYWGAEVPGLGTHSLSAGANPEAEQRMAMGASIVQSALDQLDLGHHHGGDGGPVATGRGRAARHRAHHAGHHRPRRARPARRASRGVTTRPEGTRWTETR
jgi:hypothetical protein